MIKFFHSVLGSTFKGSNFHLNIFGSFCRRYNQYSEIYLTYIQYHVISKNFGVFEFVKFLLLWLCTKEKILFET